MRWRIPASLVLAQAALVLALVGAGRAAAQTPSPLANWQYSVGDILMPLMGTPPEWQTLIGGGLALQPLYEGSQRYHLQPAPVIDIHYRDIAFISDGQGLGYNLIRGKTYRAGVALTYDLGRDQDVAPRLHGLDDIDAAPEAKLYADFTLLPFVFDVDLRRGIGGHDGYIGDVGFHVPIPLGKYFFLFAGPSVTFADRRYMQAYFGVGPVQAARSQFRRFDAQGGLKRATFGATAVYTLSDKWILASDFGAARLLGDAARSPIVESKAEFTIDASVVYKF
jgi:outer membrane scaffolding protein for murein synthesis (MipA/OmpV family)